MRFFRARHQGKKSRIIVHRNFGEHFAIQIHSGALQTADALIRTIHNERKFRFFSRRPTKP
jgi:hypothetical protein